MNKKLLIGIIAAISVVVIGVVLFFVLNSKTEVYTINFNSNGGSEVKSIKINEGDTLTLPEEPKKEGYIFNGWIDKEDKIVNNGLVINSDLELIATWIEESAKTFTVHFDSKGGSEVADLVVVEGDSLKLPNNPTKAGYKFDKWVDKNEMPILEGAILSTEDITLYAVWIKEESSNNKPSNNNQANNNKTNNNSTNTNINSNVEVESISIDKVDTIIVKDDEQLKATVKPDNATDKKLTWESSNKNVISVDSNGKITAVGIGKATITAKTSNGKSASITVESTVSRASIAITSGSQYLYYNGSNNIVNLRATVTPSGYNVDWVAPDTSGTTSSAYAKINGNSIKLTARQVWGSSLVKIPVYAKIGNIKTNTIDIYIEPELEVTPSVTCSESSVCGSLSGKTVRFTSNFDVKDWEFSNHYIIKDTEKTSRSLLIEFDSCTHNGINLKVRSNAGQVKEYILNC